MRISLLRAARAGSFAVAAIAIAACAPRAEDGTTPRASRRNSSVMDTTDLRSQDYATVYDAISAQHPDWLLPRGGPTGAGSPVLGVWIEGSISNLGVGYLRNIRPAHISQVRRLSTTESLHTYGWPWGGLVITRR